MRYMGTIARPMALALIGLMTAAGCTAKSPTSDAEQPPAAPSAEQAPPSADSPFTVRQEVAPHYTPGKSITVKVMMNYTGSEPVTAMALRTLLPQAWRYAGVQGTLRPAIEAPLGTSGEVTLIWIQIPSFPATVEFALEVPDWAEGTYTLSTQAIYRTLGGELTSPPHEVTVTGPK